MAWLELSRDPGHGGKGWAFGECLWSPTKRQDGEKWGYWELMRSVRAGDLVLHLRGQDAQAAFVGYSFADSDAYETERRPPSPGPWEYADRFYRVPLRDFTPFAAAPRLRSVFAEKGEALLEYHARHSPANEPHGRKLFFVRQSGRIQCQNGAYLSEVDEELLGIVLGIGLDVAAGQADGAQNVQTGEQLRQFAARVGQDRFSDAVRDNYSHACCFPDCGIAEDYLLVAAHIARWADAPELRGDIANGVCLCLYHDKAFELGYFTLDRSCCVRANVGKTAGSAWAEASLAPFEGRSIRQGTVRPSQAALSYHWERIGFAPD